MNEIIAKLSAVEFNAGLLHFPVGQEPDQRFIVEIDHLDTIAPGIVEVASKRRDQFQLIFIFQLLANLFQLLLVANHDPEMAHIGLLSFLNFKHRQKLMFTELEKSVSLAAAHLLEIENILIKRHRFLDVAHLDGNMIASVNFNACPARTVHERIYIATIRREKKEMPGDRAGFPASLLPAIAVFYLRQLADHVKSVDPNMVMMSPSPVTRDPDITVWSHIIV